MSALSEESLAFAKRAGQECKALRQLITALTDRVAELEANSGGGGGSPVTYSGGVASTDANGTTIFWLAGTSNPTS